MPEEISLTLTDGVRLHAESHGPAGAPVTVVLLHGWTLDGRTWYRQVTGLTAALGDAVRIVTYDARGHGRSAPITRRTATLAHLGDDLAQVLDHLTPSGPVLLAGHSMGGMTIMEYAHRHPVDFATRVGGLAFVSTTAEGHTHTAYGLPARTARLLRALEVGGAGVLARCGPWRTPRPVLDMLRPSMRWLLFGDRCDPEDIGVTTAAVARARFATIGGFRASIGTQQRLETLAGLGRIPAVALVGERDRLTPPRCAESIAGALAGTELTTCPGAGHMLMLERAVEVTDALHALALRLGAAPTAAQPTAVEAAGTRTTVAETAVATPTGTGTAGTTRTGRAVRTVPRPAAHPENTAATDPRARPDRLPPELPRPQPSQPTYGA